MSFKDVTPDEATYVKFRRRLRETGQGQTLFDTALSMLQAKGLVLQERTLVVATILETPKGHQRDDDTSTRDPSESFTKKHGKIYYGYKACVAESKDCIIIDYVFDTAKVHAAKYVDGLIEGKKQAVYGDSAYMDRSLRKCMRQHGANDRIVRRRLRGQASLSDENDNTTWPVRVCIRW